MNSSNKYISFFRETLLPATLNSYSAIFFINNKVFAAGILVITFFNFFAGFSGLIAVVTCILIADKMGFNHMQLKNGWLSFNALLIGIGMGTFFDPGLVYFSLLVLASLLTLILSVTFSGWFGKYGLPYLSMPFVFTFWFIILPSSSFENMGLTQRNVYWINEMYTIGGNDLLNFFQTIDNLNINNLLDIYLRSMSSIIFQGNIITGILIAAFLLYSSRIAFSLSVIGFIAAYLFAIFTGADAAGITYYNIGANYIMIAMGLGGFFAVPSRHSYLWAILLVPLTSLVLLFLNKLFGAIHLPVLSLPYSLVAIAFIYFLMLRMNPKNLILTPIQFYSPEKNLYSYNNNKQRLSDLIYFPIHVPFWGEWMVTQGHDGRYTHKGEWGKAFDFMLVDSDKKTYKSRGLLCENYYCYNKPVLAPADGIVEEIYDQLDDNEIGKVNAVNNWGNTIIIRHCPELYSQISHIRKGTFKVAKGDHVKRGDLLAMCGNSGRSPQPHIHFQVQSSPNLGAKTINYPLAYYFRNVDGKRELFSYSRPDEGELITDLQTHNLLKNSFAMHPGTIFNFSYSAENGIEKTEQWETFTDAWNSKYIYCKATETCAYYVNDGGMFYFTTFYGDKTSLLYYFYLVAHKVILGYYEDLEIRDELPLNIMFNGKVKMWLHDFIAPFVNRIHACYSLKFVNADNIFDPAQLTMESKIYMVAFGKTRSESSGSITLEKSRISNFTYNNNNIKIEAKCISF